MKKFPLPVPTKNAEYVQREFVHKNPEYSYLTFTGPGLGPVIVLDLSVFTEAEQMSNWEFTIYERFGEKKLKRQKINGLSDFFGEEWAKKFFAYKNMMIAQENMKDILSDIKHSYEIICELKKVVKRNLKIVKE